MKIVVCVIVLFHIMCMLNYFGNVMGNEIMIDATDCDYTGRHDEIVRIQNISHHWTIQCDITNNHNICNISISIGYITSIFFDVAYNSLYGDNISSGILVPGENATLSYYHNSSSDIEIGLRFRSYFNKSAYNDEQNEVLIEYNYIIINDRGNVVFDSSEDQVDEVDDDDDIEPVQYEDLNGDTCLGYFFMVPFVVILCLLIVKGILSNNSKCR